LSKKNLFLFHITDKQLCRNFLNEIAEFIFTSEV